MYIRFSLSPAAGRASGFSIVGTCCNFFQLRIARVKASLKSSAHLSGPGCSDKQPDFSPLAAGARKEMKVHPAPEEDFLRLVAFYIGGAFGMLKRHCFQECTIERLLLLWLIVVAVAKAFAVAATLLVLICCYCYGCDYSH